MACEEQVCVAVVHQHQGYRTTQAWPALRRWRLLRPSMHTNVASIDSLQAVVGMRNAVLRSTAHRLTAGGARVFGYWLTKAQVGICKPEAK